MKKLKTLILFTLCAVFLVVPVSGQADQKLTVASGIIGGGWYSSMAGIFEIIHANSSGIKARIVPGGGMSNQPRVGTHEVDMAWGITPFVKAAYTGKAPFPAEFKNLRCIMKPNDVFTLHSVFQADSPINSWDDVFEKKYPLKLGVVPDGISDAFAFKKLMDFYGVDFKTLESWGGKIMRAGYPDQIELMKDRHVEAVFENTFVPANPVMQIQPFRKLKFISFEQKHIDYFAKLGFQDYQIPANSYENQTDSVRSVASGSVMIVNVNVPDDVVYQITKVLVEKSAEIQKIANMQHWDPRKGIQDLPAPLHPGAAKYLKEAGLLD
ncbi:MAG: TAXI family TRAP transporter solute-binding subunit [Proteobacteria bacterium]|nr:TAXI family TRAP transporter solute-binding subunit [Pseudomonadota bacterium]